MTEYKKPKKPELAIIDCDFLIFSASASTFKPYYVYKDLEGKEIAKFDTADKGKQWLQGLIDFEMDVSKITREVEYEVGDPEVAKKNFDSLLEKWLKISGCKDYKGFCAKQSHLKTFRTGLATLREYKKGRGNAPKPPHLEIVRKHALKNPKIKAVREDLESDDYVVAVAEYLSKKNRKGFVCLVVEDKDGASVRNCWFLQPSASDKPSWNDPKTIGELEINKKGKVVGSNVLFLLWQCLAGDSCDNIGGCKGIGSKKAYNILEEFSGESIDFLPKAVLKVSQEYQKVYGDAYKYRHWDTREELVKTWKDIMIENLLLLWMKRDDKDECQLITQYL